MNKSFKSLMQEIYQGVLLKEINGGIISSLLLCNCCLSQEAICRVAFSVPKKEGLLSLIFCKGCLKESLKENEEFIFGIINKYRRE